MVLTLVVPAAIVAADVEISGDVTPGMQQVDVDSNSSKFNEYRDLRDGFYLYHFGFEALDTEKGRFLEMQGRSLLRDDQNIRIRAGQHGRYRVTFEWDEIPHRLSNGAETPFLNRGGGLFEVPATIPEIHPAFSRFTQPASNGSEKVLNTGGVGRTNAQDAADLVASDSLAAEYLDRFLHPTRLRNEREKGKLTFDYTPRKDLAFRLSLVNEDRSGNQIGYGPIGDRPPRSLNVQFVEPIDYRTQELKLTGDYVRKTYQVNLSYQLSLFENDVDFLTWQNMFVEAPEGSTFETWDRAIGAFGRRPLPQDNRYHNALLTFGLNLPLASRLVATGSWARMEQDEDLSPYSFNGVVDGASPAIDPRAGLAWNDPSKLVRDSADASIDNTMFNVDYVINPIQRLNLRAFFRFYGLDNDTPTDDWRYVTQDTTNTNGTVNFKNKRRNLAFAFDRKNYGVASTYSLAFWRTTLGLDYEREEIDRDFREADTDENIYKASLRSRPASWVMLGARYRYGDREGDGYNGRVTQQSYWYDPSVDTVDNDNPRFTFTNHPDARRYDVSDRERNLAHFLATFTVLENLALSGTYRYRNDDFDSDV
ncbi:MAG TPA: MtrB/PioB family outer membrane beta-barrel protein, partial [Rhodothermales bacterium]